MAGNAIVDPATSQTTVLVVKLNPQASQYLYVRYLGGSVKDSRQRHCGGLLRATHISPARPHRRIFRSPASGNLGTPPPSLSTQRSFVAKLDPNGDLVFSDLLGGSAVSAAQAVAVNAAGQILVSGHAVTSGFPPLPALTASPTARSIPICWSSTQPARKSIFSATGIGGSAIALDSSGNIYVAGTTYLLDYPTTPGAYQTLPGLRHLHFSFSVSRQIRERTNMSPRSIPAAQS